MYYHFLNDLKSFKTREFSTWKVYVQWLVVEVFFYKSYGDSSMVH